MITVFLGPPGSGKGTQANLLAKNGNDIKHVSTGDILRQEIASESDLGRMIQTTVEGGGFPKDEIIMQIVATVVKKNREKSIIFDGFPRTLNQAIAFDSLLGVENLKVDVVFDFDIDVPMLIERISGRYFCQECGAVYHEKNKKPRVQGVCDQCGSRKLDKRTDDKGSVLETRLKIYKEQTLPVKSYYRDKGILKVVDASMSQEKVAAYINETLSKIG